jgi:hypothetical protein
VPLVDIGGGPGGGGGCKRGCTSPGNAYAVAAADSSPGGGNIGTGASVYTEDEDEEEEEPPSTKACALGLAQLTEITLPLTSRARYSCAAACSAISRDAYSTKAHLPDRIRLILRMWPYG